MTKLQLKRLIKECISEVYSGEEYFEEPERMAYDRQISQYNKNNKQRYECPTCHTKDALSAWEKKKGYQCSRCADREEGIFETNEDTRHERFVKQIPITGHYKEDEPKGYASALYRHQKKSVLTPTGKKDSWGRPIFKGDDNMTYVDINLGKGKPSIYSTTAQGEPNIPLKNYTIKEGYGAGNPKDDPKAVGRWTVKYDSNSKPLKEANYEYFKEKAELLISKLKQIKDKKDKKIKIPVSDNINTSYVKSVMIGLGDKYPEIKKSLTDLLKYTTKK
jgi:ribosomal protein L37AE/L43A